MRANDQIDSDNDNNHDNMMKLPNGQTPDINSTT